jgi:S-adenosylmethionine decarboxylase
MLNVLAASAEKAGANVLSQIRYKFGSDSPPGFACAVLLDESHCTAHSYADLGLVAMDLFTCGNTDPRTVIEFVLDEIDLGDVEVRELPRFLTEGRRDNGQRAARRRLAETVS